MAIFILFVLAVIGAVIWAIARISNASQNARVIVNENYFKQADVVVEFKSGTIKIKNHSYNVSQVTGIRAEPYQNSHRHWGKQGVESDYRSR